MASTKAKKKVTKNAKPSPRGRAPASPAKKPAPWPSKGAPARRGPTKPAAKKKAAGKTSTGKTSAGKTSAGKTSAGKTSKSVREKGATKAAKPLAKAPKAARAVKKAQGVRTATAPSRPDIGRRSPAASPAKKASARPVRRYDRPGHLDPRYAAELRRQTVSHEHDPRAFVEEPRATDDLAEERGEEVVGKATTGEDEAEELLDQVVPEEQGGPFVETNAAEEFAHDTDASNPKDAKREPFPTT